MKNIYYKIIFLFVLLFTISIEINSQTLTFEPYNGYEQSCNDYKDNWIGCWQPTHGSPNSTNWTEVRLKTKDSGFDAKGEGVFIDLNFLGINFQQNDNYRMTFYYQKPSSATNSQLTFRAYLANNIVQSSSLNCGEEVKPSVSEKKELYTSNDFLDTTYPGQVKNIEVNFTVTQNYTYLWIYSDLISSYGDNAINYLHITRVVIEYLGGNDPDTDGDNIPDSQDDCPNEYGPSSNNGCPIECSLLPPNNIIFTEISDNSVKINWNSISENNGYHYQYKKTSSSSWINGNTNNTSKTLTGLQSNTSYYWRIKTKCTNGAYGNYSSSSNFTTLATCQENLTITQSVNSGQTDIQESSNTITVKNTIFSSATAEYDAGNTVYLKPNFHAKYGSNFRAFIEGCHGTQNSKRVHNVSYNNTNLIAISKEELIKVFPNPTKNTVTIEGSKEVDSWVVTNTYGKFYFKGDKTKSKIDMTNLPNGIYFLKAILTNGKVVTKTIIKN